jgi:hypothetical protein
MPNQKKETAHSGKNAPRNTQKNSPQNTASSNGVNSIKVTIKTPLQALTGWETEADRIANDYTRTLSPRHLRAWRMHCGGVKAQLRAYGWHLAEVLRALKGGAA